MGGWRPRHRTDRKAKTPPEAVRLGRALSGQAVGREGLNRRSSKPIRGTGRTMVRLPERRQTDSIRHLLPIRTMPPCDFPGPPCSLPLFSFSLPEVLKAQSLPAGQWSGSITTPAGTVKPVTYMVAGSPDSLSVTLLGGPGREPLRFTGLRQAGDSLYFSWPAGEGGSMVACKLVRQPDGAYTGSCIDAQGREGGMRMVPPPKE